MASTYVTLEQLRSAAAYVAANWGDHGYRVAVTGSSEHGAVFTARCSDGSTFSFVVDPWGNVHCPEHGTMVTGARCEVAVGGEAHWMGDR